MSYCPECGREFADYMQECPECEEALVPQLPEREPEEVKWVVLRALPGTVFAEMVKEVLDKNGIPCILKKDFMSSAYGSTGTGLGNLQTQIWVPAEYYGRAHLLVLEIVDPFK